MAGTVVADTIQADSTSTLLIQTGSGTPATAISIDTSQNVSVNQNLRFNSGYGSAATAYGCRAWVNFNGQTNTGGFCTIRGSGNVTSVADNGTGDYTVNFTNAMPDANYSAVSTVLFSTIGNKGGAELDSTGSFPTSSAVRLRTYTGSAAAADCSVVNVSIFR